MILGFYFEVSGYIEAMIDLTKNLVLLMASGNLTNSNGPPCNYQNKLFHYLAQWIRVLLDPTNSKTMNSKFSHTYQIVLTKKIINKQARGLLK